MKSNILILHNAPYAPIAVRLVEFGERYGRDFCLYHHSDDPMVEFYDTRYPHTVYGQFVSRYNMDNIRATTNGLMLDGGVPAWQVSAESMERVRRWLDKIYF